MRKAFRDAYNRELAILKERASEFAAEYPGLADRLGGLMRVEHHLAKYVRRGVAPGSFWWVPGLKDEVEFPNGPAGRSRPPAEARTARSNRVPVVRVRRGATGIALTAWTSEARPASSSARAATG